MSDLRGTNVRYDMTTYKAVSPEEAGSNRARHQAVSCLSRRNTAKARACGGLSLAAGSHKNRPTHPILQH